MTTILADYRHRVMVADSRISDGDRTWSGKKIWRIRGTLVGCSGNLDEIEAWLDWYHARCEGSVSRALTTLDALVLTEWGLQHYAASTTPILVRRGYEAIGSGAKAAIVAYEMTQRADPGKVVRFVCKHDSGSGLPVRKHHL